MHVLIKIQTSLIGLAGPTHVNGNEMQATRNQLNLGLIRDAVKGASIYIYIYI